MTQALTRVDHRALTYALGDVSLRECQSRGEVFQALEARALGIDRIVELGDIISGHSPGRQTDSQITVADLTGIATQDIEIAKAVYQRICHAH